MGLESCSREGNADIRKEERNKGMEEGEKQKGGWGRKTKGRNSGVPKGELIFHSVTIKYQTKIEMFSYNIKANSTNDLCANFSLTSGRIHCRWRERSIESYI